MANEFKTNYLQASLRRSEEERKEYQMSDKINLFIKDPVKNQLSIKNVIDKVTSSVPTHLMGEIDSIYVGIFDEFEKMDTNAMFKDGAIYVTSAQESEEDMVDDLVHEIAHSLEVPYGFLIYADDKVKKEFLAKRRQLYQILDNEGLNPNLELFLNAEYTKTLDLYLYQDVGYDRLNFICNSYGIFCSAYASTSLREYFANGFEHYFLDAPRYLSEISPQLYKKIEELHDYE
jgi:hypothetical protein